MVYGKPRQNKETLPATSDGTARGTIFHRLSLFVFFFHIHMPILVDNTIKMRKRVSLGAVLYVEQ